MKNPHDHVLIEILLILAFEIEKIEFKLIGARKAE
jgi:hypothetical protein